MFAMRSFPVFEQIEEWIKVCDQSQLEEELILLGSTGLEDLLQEDCKSCLTDLRNAKIKLWMLTGDKKETAENIAINCGLMDPERHQIVRLQSPAVKQVKKDVMDMKKSVAQKNYVETPRNSLWNDLKKVNHEDVEDDEATPTQEDLLTSRYSMTKEFAGVKLEPQKDIALLISGEALSVAMSDPSIEKEVNQIFNKAAAVIVYRSSPQEKAQIVKFVQRNNPEAFTLAIGDGANDVNMIQTASIGVGIMGKEGNQAAKFADFAVPNFKCLNRIVLWHGR